MVEVFRIPLHFFIRFMDDENPYAAPQVELDDSDFVLEGDPSIVRNGRKLIVPEGALLPTRCGKCNRPAHQPMTVKVAGGFTGPAGAVCLLSIFGGVGLVLILFYYEISLLWLTPFVLVAFLIVSYFQREAPPPMQATFYICSKHQLINRVFRVAWVVLMMPFFVGPWLMMEIGFDIPDYYDTRLLFLLVIVANVFSWQTFRVIGKSMVLGKGEFQGFGKKYLDSFPKSDDA